MEQMQQWLDWMHGNHPKAIRLGLDKLTPVANSLKLKNFEAVVIVVGGTNGKGSCIKTLESILLASNLKVGVYTSPHLIKYNERIRINGKNISDAACIKSFKAIKNSIDELKLNLTFFEFGTLAALHSLRQENLDVLLLEVGLGGRLDAVNIVESDIAIITTIGLDHTDFLGDTREHIAYEKAGIFRTKKIAICGEVNPPKTLLDRAKELETNFTLINQDYAYKFKPQSDTWNYLKLSNSNPIKTLELYKPNLPLQNVATALTAIEKLPELLKLKRNKTINFDTNLIDTGLKTAYLKGRFQIINYKSLELVLDVAHNKDSAEYFFNRLNNLPQKPTHAVFAIQQNKDIKNVIKPFTKLIENWHLTTINAPRAETPENIQAIIQANCENDAKVNICKDLSHLFDKLSENNKQVRVLIFGSFYTVANALRLIEKC